MKKKKEGTLIVLSGPSGVGKSTVISELLSARNDIYFSVSFTTRAPRVGEADGVNYNFVDRAEFERMIEANELLEYAEYVNNYYGTSLKVIQDKLAAGVDVLLDIEVQGAAQVSAKRPDVVRIFIAPPSWSELEKRLTQRGTDTPEKVQQRLQRAKEEVKNAHVYDYFVINDSVERAVLELDAIMTAEHCRPQDRIKDIQF